MHHSFVVVVVVVVASFDFWAWICFFLWYS